jgi:23S rRNA pseudouridine1911/1915/1917 synthase
LPVHRLDQFTSGVFCLATHPRARQALLRQLRARTLQREYLAWVEGRPSRRRGTWRHWLKLSPDQLRQTVVPATTEGATEAVAHYEVLEDCGGGVTKLRVRLQTGCKHQIRVQAAAAGLPLVGDRLYNPRRQIAFDRQALHAELLTFEHPDRPGSVLSFRAELPQDLAQLEATLRAR